MIPVFLLPAVPQENFGEKGRRVFIYRLNAQNNQHCHEIQKCNQCTSLNASEVSVDFDPSTSFCSSDVRQRVNTPVNIFITKQVNTAIHERLLLQHPFTGLFSRTTWVNRYQKGKTSVDLNEAKR